MSTYQHFLNSKLTTSKLAGFAVDESMLNQNMFPFQVHCVSKALQNGAYALFADCGMGKTIMQLAWADQVARHTSLPVLILCPLAVAAQTVAEAEKFGINGVVRWGAGTEAARAMTYVAHYEQLDGLPVSRFSGVVLDESSILKNFEGKTKNALTAAFVNTPYKLCCTATPAPNDPMELGNHAEFLGVMGRNQMLAMYFVHDGGDTDKWRLKKHSIHRFWEWVSTWAVMMARPHDIGFPMDGYQLPRLNPMERIMMTPKRDNGQLFNDMAISATMYNQELRLTKVPRIAEAAKIVNASNEPFLVWVKQNEEADEVMRLIPDAVEVRGNMPAELKADRLLGFARGEFRVLVTKPEICAYGLNYQHCTNQVFTAPDFSFEKVYQAVRRSHRFGVKKSVQVYFLTTDTMMSVKARFEKKQRDFEQMRSAMCQVMNAHSPESKTNIISYSYQPFHCPMWLQSL